MSFFPSTNISIFCIDTFTHAWVASTYYHPNNLEICFLDHHVLFFYTTNTRKAKVTYYEGTRKKKSMFIKSSLFPHEQ